MEEEREELVEEVVAWGEEATEEVERGEEATGRVEWEEEATEGVEREGKEEPMEGVHR